MRSETFIWLMAMLILISAGVQHYVLSKKLNHIILAVDEVICTQLELEK